MKRKSLRMFNPSCLVPMLSLCGLVGGLSGSAGCGQPVAPEATVFEGTFELTAAECTSPMTSPPLQAKLVVTDKDDTPAEQRLLTPLVCPLTVTTATNGVISVRGECANIPTGVERKLVLTWFVQAPMTMKEIVLAESTGLTKDLANPTSSSLDVNFADNATLKPKVRAKVMETSVEKNRFNCDRTGPIGPSESACDSMNAAPEAVGADPDTCANIEEWCTGTLFMVGNHTCN